jgi:ATP-dependent DNA ligase
MVSEMPKNYVISPNLIPDVIVAPKVVITIDADSISRSKVHGGEHGFSLRFPRLKEFGRDKEPEDTTSPSELSRLCELKRN